MALLLAALTAAALATAPEVAAQPSKVLLGTDSRVEIEVRAQDARRLKAYASTGTLSPPQLAGPEAVRFTWTPPGVRYPHTAILLFWSERGVSAPELAVLRIPLSGRTDLEVSTEPQADVRVEIGDRTFGPRRADGAGKAVIPVEVPPGLTQAKVLSEVGGVSKSVQVPLNVPHTNHLAAVAGPATLPRSGGWAWLVSAEKLDLRALRMEASGGVVDLAGALPDRAWFNVRPSNDARTVSITFRSEGAPADLASVGLEVAEPPAAQPRPLSGLLFSPGVLLGATYGGGGNLSALGSVELGFSFPAFGTGFAAGLALEANTMALSSQLTGLGLFNSWLVAFTPMATARFQVFELGAAGFHLRAGAGPALYVHQTRSDFDPSWNEHGAALEAFGGAQVSYRVGPVDVLLDVRATYGVLKTTRLSANIGGMVIAVGARMIR